MIKIYLIIFLLFLISCTSSGLQKTDKKDFFTSNDQVIFDNEKKLFKYEFSINNFSKSTINNFAYSVVFLNSKGEKSKIPGIGSNLLAVEGVYLLEKK